MQNPKFRIKAILSALIAAAMASQTAAAAFADASFGSSDYGEFRLITPVYGEPSVYGEQDIRFVDENGDEVNFNLIPEENDRISNDGALPTSYNLNTLGLVTPVKSQGDTGTCWAHSALAAAESSLIKDGLATKSIDFSEAHLVWFTQGQNTASSDPLYGDPLSLGVGTAAQDYEDGCYNQGGNIYWSIGALASWIGTANESSYPNVTTRPSIAESKRYDSTYHLQKSVIFDPSDRASIKSYLMENGALTLSYYSGNYYYTDGSYVSFYQNATDSTNHAVTLVGWDDNFSANNFKITPPGDGAWLIKNSWGTDWGYMGGYFYLSYYDTSINNIASMELEKTTNYGKVYQHNLQAMPGISAKGSSITGANEFTATGSDPLTAVSFCTSDASVPYTISIYKGCSSTNPMSGTLVHTQTGTAAYAGYHTVKLSKEVSIPSGTRFSVCVALNKADTPFWVDMNAKSTGDSFLASGIATSSSSWTDTASAWDRNVAIKAFTKRAVVAEKVKNVKAALTNGEVALTWSSAAGASKYRIRRNDGSGWTTLATVTGTTYTDSAVETGKTYSYVVIPYANGAFDTNLQSDIVKVEVNVFLTVTAQANKVTVTWNEVAGATKYRIRRNDGAGWTTMQTSAKTSFVDTTAQKGKRYTYVVYPYINGTFADPSQTVKVSLVGSSTSAAITVVTTGGQATVSWAKIAGVKKYRVRRNDGTKWQTMASTANLSWTDTTAESGKTYTYVVYISTDGVNYTDPSSTITSKP